MSYIKMIRKSAEKSATKTDQTAKPVKGNTLPLSESYQNGRNLTKGKQNV